MSSETHNEVPASGESQDSQRALIVVRAAESTDTDSPETTRLKQIRARRQAIEEQLQAVVAREDLARSAVRRRRRQRAQRGRTVLGALLLTLVREKRPGARNLVEEAIGCARDDADRAVVREVLDAALGVRRQV